jgi:Domain of unknown function (DUF4326)
MTNTPRRGLNRIAAARLPVQDRLVALPFVRSTGVRVWLEVGCATMAARCYGVRIDRKTKWGNPFVIGEDGDRSEVIAKYAAWLESKPELVAAAKRELAGKDLLCWCAPLPCHGDVLLRVANDANRGTAR